VSIDEKINALDQGDQKSANLDAATANVVEKPVGADTWDEAREARISNLARDPDGGGKISRKSRVEAEAALSLEERGVLHGVIRAPGGGADFQETAGPRTGQYWDHKAFNDEHPGKKGNFDLETSLEACRIEITHDKENLILDTRHLSAENAKALRDGIEERGLSKNVRWWP
jgi:hypothetical protein